MTASKTAVTGLRKDPLVLDKEVSIYHVDLKNDLNLIHSGKYQHFHRIMKTNIISFINESRPGSLIGSRPYPCQIKPSAKSTS